MTHLFPQVLQFLNFGNILAGRYFVSLEIKSRLIVS